MAKGNVFGPATSEIGFRGFADGKGISSPGAVAPKEPWWAKSAGLATAIVSDKLFDYLRTPTTSDEIVGEQLVEGSKSAFNDYADYLKTPEAIQSYMSRTNIPLAEKAGELNQDIARAEEMGREEDVAFLSKKRDETLSNMISEEDAAKWAITERESLPQRYNELRAAQQKENPNIGKAIVDPKINIWGFKPDLEKGYVYRSDINDPYKEQKGFFDGIDKWWNWSK